MTTWQCPLSKSHSSSGWFPLRPMLLVLATDVASWPSSNTCHRAEAQVCLHVPGCAVFLRHLYVP